MEIAHQVTSDAELDKLYEAPSGGAVVKEIDYVSDHYRAFIEKSPFVIVATVGPEGLDCSPRGDPAGFVRVADRKTVMLPDRRGNNRIDALRNLVRDPRISLLFMLPGIGETLRINGRAVISSDPQLCATFEMQGKAPRTVIIITVDRVYIQCGKALTRSRLWELSSRIDRASLPSLGDILEALSRGEIEATAFEAAYPERMRQTMY